MARFRKRRDRNNPDVAFYLRERPRAFEYFSTAKIDSMFDQIPAPIVKTITASFGIKLPAIPGVPVEAGVAVDAELQRGASNEYAKLAVVLRRQHELGEIGTVGRPKGLFAGVLSLRWASAAEKFMFLSGHSGRTMVVLTGSLRHVVSRLGPLPEVSQSGSSAQGAYNFLVEVLEGEHSTSPLLDLALQNREGPTQKLEFVAERFSLERGHYPSQGRKLGDFEVFRDSTFSVLHGSPLYLALPAGSL